MRRADHPPRRQLSLYLPLFPTPPLPLSYQHPTLHFDRFWTQLSRDMTSRSRGALANLEHSSRTCQNAVLANVSSPWRSNLAQNSAHGTSSGRVRLALDWSTCHSLLVYVASFFVSGSNAISTFLLGSIWLEIRLLEHDADVSAH
jgi:hypothetical protein